MSEKTIEEVIHNTKGWAKEYLLALQRVEEAKAQYKVWAGIARARLSTEEAYQTAYDVYWDNPDFPPGLTGLICGLEAGKVASYLVKREHANCVKCGTPMILKTRKNHSIIETMCDRCAKERRKAEYGARYTLTPEQQAAREAMEQRHQQQEMARLAALQALKDMPYDEYLKTDHWKEVRKDAMKRAGYRCQLCNTKEHPLQVHHRTYENRGHEQRNDVVVLCRPCHAKHHGKEE